MSKTKFLVQAALIAAIYAVLTILLAPISYGPIQIRISEALTVLPMFTPAAIPGLFIGCIVSNMFGGAGLIDVIFGSLATLIAAFLSRLLRNKPYLVPLPPVIANGIIIGFVLNYVSHAPLFFTMFTVAAGELVACYAVGYPLILLFKKYGNKIFRQNV